MDGINSINIYDGKKKILYTPGGEYEADSYSGINFKEYSDHIPYALKEFYIPAKDSVENKLIYSYTLEDTNNLIIIDIDSERFYNNFTNYHIENDSHILITNKQNKTVYTTDESIQVEKIPYTNNYKLIKHNGTEYMCFSVTSSITEYTYTTLIPYNSVTKSVTMQRKYYYFMIILIIMLLCIFITYMSTLKIKKPLTQLLDKSDMYDRYKYNAELKKNQVILKNYLTTEFPSNEDTQAFYNILKDEITESSNSLTLLSFSYDEIPDKKVSVTNKEFEALMYGISNICTEIAAKYSKVQFTYDTDKSIILICANINFDSEKLEQAHILTTEFIILFINHLKKAGKLR